MYRERDRRHNPKHGPEYFLQSGAEKKACTEFIEVYREPFRDDTPARSRYA
jgi:hypothetical protein